MPLEIIFKELISIRLILIQLVYQTMKQVGNQIFSPEQENGRQFLQIGLVNRLECVIEKTTDMTRQLKRIKNFVQIFVGP